MNNTMILIAGTVASVLVITPIVAILLASFASLREDYADSLSGSAPGLATRLARRMLGYRSDPPAAPARQPADRRPQPRQVRVPAGV